MYVANADVESTSMLRLSLLYVLNISLGLHNSFRFLFNVDQMVTPSMDPLSLLLIVSGVVRGWSQAHLPWTRTPGQTSVHVHNHTYGESAVNVTCTSLDATC